LRAEVTGVASSLLRKNEPLSSRGDSGENDGNEVRDLSEAAMDDAELEGCDVSFLRVRAVDRWLHIEVADCCETERSRGAEEGAVVASMLSVRLWHRSGVCLLAGFRQQQRRDGACALESQSRSRNRNRLDYRVNPPLSMWRSAIAGLSGSKRERTGEKDGNSRWKYE
jgi:hypothetical protein